METPDFEQIVMIAELTEVPRDSEGRRRCVDCGGWQLGQGHTALFFPVLVAENTIGWICESCTLDRLKRRALIINATSSASVQIPRRVIDAIDACRGRYGAKSDA